MRGNGLCIESMYRMRAADSGGRREIGEVPIGRVRRRQEWLEAKAGRHCFQGRNVLTAEGAPGIDEHRGDVRPAIDEQMVARSYRVVVLQGLGRQRRCAIGLDGPRTVGDPIPAGDGKDAAGLEPSEEDIPRLRRVQRVLRE